MGSSKRTRAAAPAALPQSPGKAGGAAAGSPTSGSPANGEQRSCLTSQLRKTRICVYHLRGACHYGNTCSFAHSCTELQSTPDLRKTRLCQAFEQGFCDKKDCSFAHGEEELRTTDLFYKKALCIWHAKGKCRSGNQCRFAHGVADLRPQQGLRQGGAQQPAAGGKKKAASEAKEKALKFEKEPMKVMPAVCLTPPQLGLQSEAGFAEVDLQCDAADFGQSILLGAPPGLGYTGDDMPSLKMDGGDAAAWWQWHNGYNFTPDMNVMADLDHLNYDIMNNNFDSDIDQLQAEAASIAQRYEQMRAKYETALDKDALGTYLKVAPGLDLDPAIPSTFWGA